MPDPKRELLRHLVATVVYRGGLAISGATPDFASFRAYDTTRTPGELLAHIGDLFEGSLYIVKGELVYLTSGSLPWEKEIARFFSAATELDSYIASGAPLACPVEKLVQGPVGDALTHVGQIVMLRRMAGQPVRAEGYFEADIVPGQVYKETFEKEKMQ